MPKEDEDLEGRNGTEDDKPDTELDDDLDTEDGGQGENGDGTEDDKPLGPKGEKALEAIKEKLREEKAKRRAAEEKLAERGKPDGGNGDGGKDDAAEQARREADKAATGRANQKILRSEIRAAAAGKLADPKDALRLLDLDQFEVSADGEVDEDEIADAIADLVKRKPYLAAEQGSRARFEGGGDGGARKPPKSQITEEQLQKMSKAEIAKAYAEGKLAHLL